MLCAVAGVVAGAVAGAVINGHIVQDLTSPERFIYVITPLFLCGPGISVGIATGYGMEGPGIESRWG